MRGFFRLCGAFALSLLVSGMVAVWIADFARAGEEFILVFIALPLFLLLAIVLFAVGVSLSGHKSTHRKLALGLAALIAAAIAGTMLLARASMHGSDAILLGTFAFSALAGLAVQWLLTRKLADS